MTAITQWWPRSKEFFREVVAEARKVSWPESKSVLNTTVVVIVTTFLIAFFLAGCDVVLAKMISTIYKFFGV